MEKFNFTAELQEVSEILICVEAENEEGAKQIISDRAFDWNEDTELLEYLKTDITKLKRRNI